LFDYLVKELAMIRKAHKAIRELALFTTGVTRGRSRASLLDRGSNTYVPS